MCCQEDLANPPSALHPLFSVLALRSNLDLETQILSQGPTTMCFEQLKSSKLFLEDMMSGMERNGTGLLLWLFPHQTIDPTALTLSLIFFTNSVLDTWIHLSLCLCGLEQDRTLAANLISSHMTPRSPIPSGRKPTTNAIRGNKVASTI